MNLAVICFLWGDPKSRWRDAYTYGPHHVVTLRNMVARHLGVPHKFICVTDSPDALPADIETVPLDTSLITPGARFAKLMLYRPDAAELFGADRLLYLDLDNVIVGNIDHLVNHDNEFMAWKNPRFAKQPARRARFNTSLVYLKSGARPEIWNRFDIVTSPAAVKASGASGTDQVWLSMNVSPDEPGWDQADGIYSFKIDCQSGFPGNARVIVFHGSVSPCLPAVQKRHRWIAEYYH